MSTEPLDPMTGLMKAQAFERGLEEAIRNGENLILINLDLDHFMEFNQKYGHDAGDAWLKVVAERFNQTFSGEHALISRYGGDEFMAAITHQGLLDIYEKAEALRQSFEKETPEIVINGEAMRLGQKISIGLATFPGNATSASDLIEKAKLTLLRAKSAGGNCVSYYQEIDPLTGLLNSDAYQLILEENLANARKNNENLSILSIDIDEFKSINDEYGHRAGDEILKRLAHILDSNFKAMGHCVRIGGDAFLVILPGQRPDSAFILAEEIRRLIDDSEISLTFGSNTQNRSISLKFHISGGIASFPSDANDRVDLLRKAEEALYRSKTTGRNRISLPTSAQMITKTSYYTQIQLERLAKLARSLDKTEAFLLREALDDLLLKYKENEK
jgi:diguanylate cyclase (GGDEF)-like protein